MASSSPRTCTFSVSLKALLLVSSFLAMTAASPVATAQVVQLTVLNHVTQPLQVSNTSPAPGSTGSISITVMPGGTGFLALDAADPAAVLLFNVGPDTYVLVSDNDLDRVFRDTRAGVTMTVSGPPCVGGRGGLQTVTAVLENSVAKCAEMDM